MTQAPEPRTARRVGVAVVVLVTIVVAGLQIVRGRGHSERALDEAFSELAQADLVGGKPRQEHVANAHRLFAKATAVVMLEPQALVGAAVTDNLQRHWGDPILLAKDPTQCSDEELAGHVRGLLERARVRQAEQFLAVPFVAQRRGALGALVPFTERWRRAQQAVAGEAK
ncbi:MAG: hypothetical protein FJ100_14125 [Deltaproteobacteria bacterium]|nr:hypothetical protein [Deltaproteobacteria bacterium]